MNFSTIVSMTPGDSGPNDTIASRRLRNSGLKTFSIACFERCCDAFCRLSTVRSDAGDSQKPIVPALSSREPAFDVMISTTWRKSALRPLLSVSVAWSITCSRTLKMSGCAFSISSSSSTA